MRPINTTGARMGATTFFAKATGPTAEEAFKRERWSAQSEYGCGGYTGTIAEKSEFVMIDVGDCDPYETANKLIDEDDPRVSDKWGPAGCIDLTDTPHAFGGPNGRHRKTYLFFGWASE
jgi:hypothetical protein